jgi:hypothetical protein
MTVRNWSENSSGNWTLTVTNSGSSNGNLTLANLTVYGTPTSAPANPLPVLSLQASRSLAFAGSSITLNATAIDRNSNNTAGSIAKVEFFSNNGSGPVSIGNATSAPYSISWSTNSTGNYTFTATATDRGDATSNSTAVSATSAPITVRIDRRPYAAWDFDTLKVDPEFDPNNPDDDPAGKVSLSTALQSSRKYSANFGSNNGTIAQILFHGGNGSSLWNSSGGEIWTGTGSTENFLADTNPFGSNSALLLRGGTNLSANGKSIVFQLDMTQARRLEISYAAEASPGGFTTHVWHFWDDVAKSWKPILDENGNATIVVPPASAEIVLDQVPGAGFNGRANARVRLTVNGATAVGGTNLLDNIRFNATVAP